MPTDGGRERVVTTAFKAGVGEEMVGDVGEDGWTAVVKDAAGDLVAVETCIEVGEDKTG